MHMDLFAEIRYLASRIRIDLDTIDRLLGDIEADAHAERVKIGRFALSQVWGGHKSLDLPRMLAWHGVPAGTHRACAIHVDGHCWPASCRSTGH